jgi:hypothetical protein
MPLFHINTEHACTKSGAISSTSSPHASLKSPKQSSVKEKEKTSMSGNNNLTHQNTDEYYQRGVAMD